MALEAHLCLWRVNSLGAGALAVLLTKAFPEPGAEDTNARLYPALGQKVAQGSGQRLESRGSWPAGGLCPRDKVPGARGETLGFSLRSLLLSTPGRAP